MKEAGKGFHELLQDAHRRAGTLVRADFEADPWTVTGGLLRGHPDLLTLLGMEHGLELWDIKSVKDGGYRIVLKDGIKDDDAEQLNAYMALTGVKQGGIVYVNRNNGEFQDLAWTFNEDLWQSSMEKLAALKKWDQGDGLPDPLDPKNFRCSYTTKDRVRVDCQFYSLCHPQLAAPSRITPVEPEAVSQ